MLTLLMTLNLVASLASVLAAGVALIRPAFLSGLTHVSGGEVFFVRMYVARSIPLGLAAGLLPFWMGPASVWLLFVAAMVQAIDVGVGFRQGERKMMAGATVAAIVHLICGFAIM